MEPGHLRHFHEVAGQKSFTKAARALRVSQPAISKTLKILEDAVGAKLLYRDRRRVELTDIGRAFYERTTRIFAEIENLGRIRDEYLTGCAGELGLGASDNLCNYVLPDVLGGFCKSFPQVNVKLLSGTSGDIKAQILSGAIELGMFYTPLARDERAMFHADAIGAVEFVCVMPGRSGPQKNRQASPDLRALLKTGLRYIGSRAADYRKAYPALKMHQLLGLNPKVYIETNNQETQKRLVIGGHGYTILPVHAAKDGLLAGTLVKVGTSVPLCNPVFLVRRRAGILTKPAREFAAFIARRRFPLSQ